ncbi:MAG: hypothetical protein ACTHN8_10560 [Angustibacter sp.]
MSEPTDQPGEQQAGEQQAGAAVVPSLPQTGDERVDEALEPLGGVGELPAAEQVEVYVGVHRALQDRLADLEG